MENKALIKKDLGGSLPVENVQALASNNLKDIPPRYLRPEAELEQVSIEESLQIPVVDMDKLVGDPLFHDDEMAKLHLACKEWGFFQLINHGVSEELIKKMKTDTEEFFGLPLEVKKAYATQPNHIEGYGQAFVVSEEQKLDWGDMLFLLTQPVRQRTLMFWPTLPTSFSETLNRYSQELQQVTIYLLKFISSNLGVNLEMERMFDDGVQGARMNYYPPCPQANKVIGLTPHSDAVGLTLLLQVNEVQGLQIRIKGKWIPIKPVVGAFIVNVGDIIEIVSNGIYKSIEHRAVVNPEKERLSIAAFHSPNIGSMIGPLPDLIKENVSNYKTISYEEYIKLIVTSKLDGKSLLDQMRLNQELH
ncbi:S-norcoclaurine synthase 1-like [Argentina anserina]|uniref:S-norcoclaurine synthase 1-like n=1 Tax=Argentina anserina TaxID=57926 RepID=UPI0021766BC6|nr:S-norcoclaurine synthase 1-like [Potentilla anserina]